MKQKYAPRKCVIKAPGCKITFIPINSRGMVCSNKACIRERHCQTAKRWVENHPEKQKEYQARLKNVMACKTIFRLRRCIGALCRGVKAPRRMPKGQFMCVPCQVYAGTYQGSVI